MACRFASLAPCCYSPPPSPPELQDHDEKALVAACAVLSLLAAPLEADDAADLAETVEEYLELTEYGSSVILPEQIPAEDWPDILVIDARDAAQFEADHIPGAVNIEWRCCRSTMQR